MSTTNNLFNHKQTNTFEGYTTFASCYMLHIARRAAVASVKAAYSKSGLPFLHELLQAVIHGEGIGEDILQEAFIAVWKVAEGNPMSDYSTIKEEGRRAVYRAVNRYIYGERKKANIADIATMEGAIEDIAFSMEGEEAITEDIIRAIVYALPKQANKGLYCRVLKGTIEGYTAKELATSEGVHISRIYAVLNRCHQILEEAGYTTANINKAQ